MHVHIWPQSFGQLVNSIKVYWMIGNKISDRFSQPLDLLEALEKFILYNLNFTF